MPEEKSQTTPPVDVVNQYTGEKWYYTDIVKEHFFNPRNLMLEDPDEAQYSAVGMVGSPACLVSSTTVQKNPSVGKTSAVAVGDRLLGHDGFFHPVERLFHPRYTTTLARLKNPMGELTATKDHLIYAMQIPRKKNSPFVHTRYKKRMFPSWVHVGDVKRGDIILYPIPKEVRGIKTIVLPASARKRFDYKSVPLPPKIAVAEDVLELFGYYVAEGHTKNTEIGFTFGGGEMRLVKRVQEIIKEYFGLSASFRLRPQQHRIDVSVYNVFLAGLFREWFGSGAAKKRIPEWLMFLSSELQRGFLRGVWRGDGYFGLKRSQPRAGFTTISDTLLHQMRYLLLRQGIIPSIYRERAAIKGGVRHQAAYRIHVGDMASLERLAAILKIPFTRDPNKRHEEEVWRDKNFVYLPVRGVGAQSFRGRLYNFEVGESHTYATDAFLVHNCGDMMKMWLAIAPDTERVTELKWRTFGCASAIAATSMFSVMVTENGGMPIGEALKIRPQDIMARLGGLPNRKIHCSVLADKAFRKAANDYFHKTGQHGRVVVEGARVVDPKLNITDHDIEEAVLEGATDLDAVQQKLKVGVGSPDIITEVEQLIRFYKEKYYG